MSKKKKAKKQITPNSLRAEFLKKAKPIMDGYIEVASGNGAMKGSKEIHGKIWDVLSQVILQADDMRKIHVQSNADILKLLRNGKVTVGEAERLMGVMQKMFEMEQLPELLDKFEGMNK